MSGIEHSKVREGTYCRDIFGVLSYCDAALIDNSISEGGWSQVGQSLQFFLDHAGADQTARMSDRIAEIGTANVHRAQ
jgi:hypothetical protein